jgi:serine/threonine protein kinase
MTSSHNSKNDETFLPEYTSITNTKKWVEGSIEHMLHKKELAITNSNDLINFAKEHGLPSEDTYQNGWFLLGSGANSKVFLGEYRGELVAVKRLTSYTFNEDRLKEVRQLSHTNLVKILDLIEVEEKSKKHRHLVMELMETDLFCHISKNEKTPTLFWHSEGMQYAIDIISGLEYLHSRSLIHKDIKSGNIFLKLISKPTDWLDDQYMFVPRMTAKIGDLDNMRKEDKVNPYLLLPSAHTPQYASPEQFKDSKNLTTASDIYSFGVLLWELATKQQPWQGAGGMEVLQQTTAGNFVNVHRKFLEDKIDLLNVISKCCDMAPQNRPNATTVKEMIKKLPPYLNV